MNNQKTLAKFVDLEISAVKKIFGTAQYKEQKRVAKQAEGVLKTLYAEKEFILALDDGAARMLLETLVTTHKEPEVKGYDRIRRQVQILKQQTVPASS